MAAQRKPAARKVRFELTYSGIAGIGVVCFCIFLWMFLFGVWTGQTLLLPVTAPDSGTGTVAELAAGQPGLSSADPLRIEPVREKKVRKE